MKDELEKQLITKYPKIFVDANKSMVESCMYWGIECPDAWYHLIDNLCEHIQSYIDNNNVAQVVADQVKEKFGTLRFYYHGGDDHVDGMVSHAEHLSGKLCASCGTNLDVGYTLGWITHLCRTCFTNNGKKGSTWVPNENNKDETVRVTMV